MVVVVVVFSTHLQELLPLNKQLQPSRQVSEAHSGTSARLQPNDWTVVVVVEVVVVVFSMHLQVSMPLNKQLQPSRQVSEAHSGTCAELQPNDWTVVVVVEDVVVGAIVVVGPKVVVGAKVVVVEPQSTGGQLPTAQLRTASASVAVSAQSVHMSTQRFT